jgi:hypothetical protein
VEDSSIEAYNKAREIIATAQSEGRSLTQEELDKVVAASNTIWDAATAAEKLTEENEKWVSEIDYLE